MNDTTSKKAEAYLQSDQQDLPLLFAKIKALTELDQHLTKHLEPTIRQYCQVANVVGNRLILLAANGSIATQIRFQTPDLLRKFKSDVKLKYIQDILCKVRPAPSRQADRAKPASSPMRALSPTTANIVKEIAESIEDPKLREVMERIAGRTKI